MFESRAPNRLDANSDTRSGISVLNYIRMYIVVIYVLILDDFIDQLLGPKKSLLLLEPPLMR